MSNVFISHSSKDVDFVDTILLPFLQEHGIDPWFSADDILTAEEWERSIVDALRSCEWFMVVLSRNAVRSDWVRAEVHWAMEERPGQIVPILIEDCDIDELHLKLRRVQHVDFRVDTPAARARLLTPWFGSAGAAASASSPKPKQVLDRRCRVFFNNGWDGFDPKSDKDVLFHLPLAGSRDLVRHIELVRQEGAMDFNARPGGPQPEQASILSVSLGSTARGRQLPIVYDRFLERCAPVVPKEVQLEPLEGNAEATWKWRMRLPAHWLRLRPPFVTEEGKQKICQMVDAWIVVHTAEIRRIKEEARSTNTSETRKLRD